MKKSDWNAANLAEDRRIVHWDHDNPRISKQKQINHGCFNTLSAHLPAAIRTANILHLDYVNTRMDSHVQCIPRSKITNISIRATAIRTSLANERASHDPYPRWETTGRWWSAAAWNHLQLGYNSDDNLSRRRTTSTHSYANPFRDNLREIIPPVVSLLFSYLKKVRVDCWWVYKRCSVMRVRSLRNWFFYVILCTSRMLSLCNYFITGVIQSRFSR